MSIRDDLTRLVELQSAENARRRLESDLADLPAERERLRKANEVAVAKVARVEQEREESLKERRQLEGELQGAEAQVDKYREQEMMVKRNEELWAIQKEIKAVQEKIDRLESGILEQMEAADQGAEEIEDAKRDAERVAAEVKEEIGRVDGRERELNADLERIRGEIEELRAATGDDALDRFDRIAKMREGVAMAEMAGGGCSQCQVRQRPQLALEVVKMSDLKQCENCKRILFDRDALELPSDMSVGAG